MTDVCDWHFMLSEELFESLGRHLRLTVQLVQFVRVESDQILLCLIHLERSLRRLLKAANIFCEGKLNLALKHHGEVAELLRKLFESKTICEALDQLHLVYGKIVDESTGVDKRKKGLEAINYQLKVAFVLIHQTVLVGEVQSHS